MLDTCLPAGQFGGILDTRGKINDVEKKKGGKKLRSGKVFDAYIGKI
jgi:hypothetical protein